MHPNMSRSMKTHCKITDVKVHKQKFEGLGLCVSCIGIID